MATDIAMETTTGAGTNADAGAGAGTAPLSTDVHYTVFIRLPFARGQFVDPPSIEWDAAKDRALWKILSNTPPKRGALNWNELSTRFNVPLPFILQQAAWLYERQLSQVRAQMRKVGGSGVGAVQNTSSHAPGTPGALSYNSGTAVAMNAGGVQMRRLGSAGSRGARSSLTGTSKDGNASTLAGERSGSGAGPPQATGLRRPQTVPTSKKTEAQGETSESLRQSRNQGFQRSAGTFPSSKVQSERRTRSPGSRPEPASASSSGRQAQSPQFQSSKSASGPLRSDGDDDEDLSSTSSSKSSSDSSANYDSATYPIRRSQIFRQPPRFSSKKRENRRDRGSSYSNDEAKNDNGYDDYDGNADDDGDDNDEDDDENPTFLPFAQQGRQSGSSKQQQRQSGQQSSTSVTPTATTVRSGPGVAGGSFRRSRQQERGQTRAQQERISENSIVSSEGSPLSSSDAAASTFRSLDVAGESASTSTKNGATITSTITGRDKAQARAPESTAATVTTRLSRHREPQIGRPTQSPITGSGTGITSQLSSKPATSKSTQPQHQHQHQHHSNSSSNSNISSNHNNNNNNKYNNNKHNRHRVQGPNQDQPQSQSQSQSQSSQPHRADPAAQLSPRQRALRRRENNPGSDGGTPSMGSSFSDLDDTSVTQSALEEALLSNMQHRGGSAGSSIGTAVGGGAIASRMSSLSQALRSKYL